MIRPTGSSPNPSPGTVDTAAPPNTPRVNEPPDPASKPHEAILNTIPGQSGPTGTSPADQEVRVHHGGHTFI